MKFSYFLYGSNDCNPYKEITIQELEYMFKLDAEIKEKVEHCRVLKESGDSKAYSEAKNKLPYITPTGLFTYRNNKSFIKESYTWIAPLDIDGKDNVNVDWIKLAEKIRQHPSIILTLQSPSGKGIKALIRMKTGAFNIDDHYPIMRDVVYKYLNELWGCKLDISQGKLSQPFFITHDPNIYFNIRATELDIDYTKIAVKEVVKEARKVDGVYKSVTDLDRFAGYIRNRINDKYHYFGRLSLFIGGLYQGGFFKEDESFVLQELLNAADNNPNVIDYKVARKWIETSFNNGRLRPITADVLQERKGIEHILNELNNLTKFEPATTPTFTLDDVDENEPEEGRVIFPVEVLPQNMQDFIRMCNLTLNFSPDFTACSMMSAMAVLIGNTFKLRVKTGWNAPLIFWFSIIGEPGTLKSHPLKVAYDPLKKIDMQQKAVWDIEMDKFKEYERNKDKPENKNMEPMNKPKFMQTIISDYTIESLYPIHDYNKRGIGLYRDELVGFLNDMNKYRKGSDEQFWLESFNNSSYTVNRVTKDPILLSDICINVIGTIQPEVLFKEIRNRDGNGFIDRFLFTEAEKTVTPINDIHIDAGWFTWWDEICKNTNHYAYYNSKEDEIIYDFSPEAFKRFIEIDVIFCDLQNGADADTNLKSYISKLKTYLPRFALMVCMLDTFIDGVNSQKLVTLDHLERAYKLIEYFLQTGRKVFANVKTSGEIGGVVSTMRGKTNRDKIVELFKMGYKKADIIKESKCSKTYVYNVLREEAQKKVN